MPTQKQKAEDVINEIGAGLDWLFCFIDSNGVGDDRRLRILSEQDIETLLMCFQEGHDLLSKELERRRRKERVPP